MTPRLYLRIAAFLTLVHCVGHTARTMLSRPVQGSPEMGVLQTMMSHAFNFSGFQRSYWDFFRGFGWFLTIQLASQAIIFWCLGDLTKNPPPQLRPILIVLTLTFGVMAVFSFRYFTLGPIVIEGLIAACFLGATVATRRAAH